MSEPFPTLDFDEFHRVELPLRLAAGGGAEAARGVRGVGSLAFRLTDGGAYTYLLQGDGIEIAEGDERADTVIELSHESWQGIVHELETGPGLMYGGRVKCLRGNAMKFIGWDPGLRAMYNGHTVFDPSDTALLDADGSPLAVDRSFHLDDEPNEMAHFLRTAGYLIVRGVFDEAEIAGFREDAEALRTTARKGDKLSWWGKNAAGEEILCRVTNAGTRPRLRAIPTDTRLTRLVALADEPLTARAADSEQGVSVIYKNPEMSEGLSDIPWHRDCGMGGHAVMCPVLIASTYLTDATPQTGDLRVLPGSWQGACGFIDPSNPDAPKGVSVDAKPGDVSFHYGDVMHTAPPPKGDGPYRVSVVTAFVKRGARNHRGDKSYNDVLLSREDGQVEHLADVAKRS